MIIIRAKRWFQRTYGNTYHSVRVFVDNQEVGYCPFTYGYGDHYMQTAHKLLQAAEVYPKTDRRLNGTCQDYYEFRMDMRERRDKFMVFCDDVTRKRDLD